MKTCCGYSLEAPHQGASNMHPHSMFLWQNKKYIYLIPLLSSTMLQQINNEIQEGHDGPVTLT